MVVVAAVVGAAPSGCGQIVEVPIAMTSGTEQTSDELDETTGEATTHDPTGGAGSTPIDVDDASTSSPADDGSSSGSSSGGGTREPLTICGQLGKGIEIAEDDPWTETTLEIPPLDDVGTLRLSVRVTHPRVAELRLVLHAPDGTNVVLLDEPRCEGANIEAIFEDGATQLGNDQCLTDVAAIAGSVAALDGLDALLRTPVGGTWTLAITDTMPEQSGYLDQVCLVLVVEG
jgi:subtilisin-like proprotein convertase family protein